MVDGLLRIVLRYQCDFNTQIQKQTDLFTVLLDGCHDVYKPLFGIPVHCSKTYDQLLEKIKVVNIRQGSFQYCHIAEMAFAMHTWLQQNVHKRQQVRYEQIKEDQKIEEEEYNNQQFKHFANNENDNDSDHHANETALQIEQNEDESEEEHDYRGLD